MTVDTKTAENNAVEQKNNDKEFNFRQIEKRLYEEKLEKERLAKEKEQLALELDQIRKLALQRNNEEEDDDSEPYVDHKRLNKKLAKFGEQYQKNTNTQIQQAVQNALQEERQRTWVESNPDFYDVLQQHAEKLLQKAPKLAESILRMPDSFERQQLVYNNIKALGLDAPEPKQSSIQDKVDANRRSPFYQPATMGTAPYAQGGDFSPSGIKNSYAKMQELKNRLRI